MALQPVNVGTGYNDPNADNLRDAFQKLNANDLDLLATIAEGPSDSVFFASHQEGVVLDSNVLTGGGTDTTAALQAILDRLNELPNGGMLVFDGAALTTTALFVGSNTTIFAPNKACGIYMANNSSAPLFANMDRNGAGGALNNGVMYQKNISIIGGTWNQNGTHQSSEDTTIPGNPKFPGQHTRNFWTFGFCFIGVDGLTFKNTTILNSQTFAYLVGNAKNVWLEDCIAQWDAVAQTANNDGFHFWGPIVQSLNIRNCRTINGSDDTVGLNYAENDPALGPGAPHVNDYQELSVGYGSGYALIDGMIATGSGLRTVVYSNATNGDLTVKNWTQPDNPTLITQTAMISNGMWNNVFFQNWNLYGHTQRNLLFTGMNLQRLTIDRVTGMKLNETTGTGPLAHDGFIWLVDCIVFAPLLLSNLTTSWETTRSNDVVRIQTSGILGPVLLTNVYAPGFLNLANGISGISYFSFAGIYPDPPRAFVAGTAVYNQTLPGPYANDAAAAAGGVAVGQNYRNGSVVQIRVT